MKNINITSSELISTGKEKLKGNYWKAFLVVFIYGIFQGLLTSLGEINEIMSFVANIGTIILDAILAFGLYHAFTILYKESKINPESLFHVTSPFVRNLLITILTSLYILFWSMLFIVPGIIKSYSYRLVYQVANDHPELSASECITKSRQLMNGHKMDLFITDFKLYFVPAIFLAIGMGIVFSEFINLLIAISNNQTPDLSNLLTPSALIFASIGSIITLFVRPLAILCEVSLYQLLNKEEKSLEETKEIIDELLQN